MIDLGRETICGLGDAGKTGADRRVRHFVRLGVEAEGFQTFPSIGLRPVRDFGVGELDHRAGGHLRRPMALDLMLGLPGGASTPSETHMARRVA